MTTRRSWRAAVVLAALAVAFGVAIGDPPPKEPPHPGVVSYQADQAGGTNGDIHIGS
jgi:hypothetical protein